MGQRHSEYNRADYDYYVEPAGNGAAPALRRGSAGYRALAEPIELLNFKTVYRGNVVAIVDVQVINLFILRGFEVHRKNGFCFVKMPRTIGWRTRRVTSRFNIAVLTTIGFRHPELFKTGRPAPLFDIEQRDEPPAPGLAGGSRF